jgi:aldehyde:ferredoxin oxidoreductase
VKNRVLAAAYAGARPFGIEVFEPETSNTLMAALLVHDLVNGVPAFAQPWQEEAYAAAHGGLWRSAYDPRSALGLAVLLGMAGARG